MTKHTFSGASPRHDAHYRTDPTGKFCIMQVSMYEGKKHRAVLPSPRFSDLGEADRYCRDWNIFGGVQFIVVEVG